MGAKEEVLKLLKNTKIQINGNNPCDIRVYNEEFYQKIISQGSLGLGESYMDGWWDCDKLDELFYQVLKNKVDSRMKVNLNLALVYAKARLFNLQSSSRAFQIGEKHYDIGNDLYKRMLDKNLVYTCAYWKNSKNLNDAQEAKLDLVCKKLGLKKGDKILDIGCGWGSFAKYAAKKYKVKVIGITVSKEQAELARKLCKGLDVEIRLQDYRDVNEKEKFDHIVSLGMFEHVGVKNYREYFKVASRNLKPNGLFLLHTIGSNKSRINMDPWITKYIFTNSMLPSIKQISESIEGLFIIEDLHNFGADYDKTLMAWYSNFNKNWKDIEKKYGQRFYRMWRYYLLSCAGMFRSRTTQLWQIVLSKNGVPGGYSRIN